MSTTLGDLIRSTGRACAGCGSLLRTWQCGDGRWLCDGCIATEVRRAESFAARYPLCRHGMARTCLRCRLEGAA